LSLITWKEKFSKPKGRRRAKEFLSEFRKYLKDEPSQLDGLDRDLPDLEGEVE